MGHVKHFNYGKISRAKAIPILHVLTLGLIHQRTLDKAQIKMVSEFMVSLIQDQTDIILIKDQLSAANKERELEIFSKALTNYFLDLNS